jgi:hypothetical protein
MLAYADCSKEIMRALVQWYKMQHTVPSHALLHPDTYTSIVAEWKAELPAHLRSTPAPDISLVTIAGCRVMLASRIHPDRIEFE